MENENHQFKSCIQFNWTLRHPLSPICLRPSRDLHHIHSSSGIRECVCKSHGANVLRTISSPTFTYIIEHFVQVGGVHDEVGVAHHVVYGVRLRSNVNKTRM